MKPIRRPNMTNTNSDELQFVELCSGQAYPLPLPPQKEGAATQFLTNTGNTLQIILPGMSAKEQKALWLGMIKSGLLYSNGAMLFLFQFYGDNGRPLLTFDASFDIRLQSTEGRYLHNINNAEQRLAIDLHGVDGNGILRALRLVSMPPGMTIKFLTAAQDQLVETRSGAKEMAEWLCLQPDDLINKTKTWVLGT